MSVKIPLITVKFASLCFLSVMVLSVCVQPVDIEVFMKDPTVVKIIDEQNKGTEIDPPKEPPKEPPKDPPPNGPSSIKVDITFNSASEAEWSFSTSTISLSKNDNSKTVTLSSTGFTDIKWYLDCFGEIGTGNTITLNWSDLVSTKKIPTGSYKLYVIAKKGGMTYSSEKTNVTVIISH